MKQQIEVRVCGCSSCMMHGAGEIVEAIEQVCDIDGLIEEGQEVVVSLDTFARTTPHDKECPVVQVGKRTFLGARAQLVTSYMLKELGRD